MARNLCPVNGWLAAHRPALLPHDPDPDRIAALRARTDLMDQLLLQIRDRAVADGESLEVWNLGAGFDARWARMAGPLSPAVTRWVEVEEPRVIAAKRAALLDSPFDEHWRRVQTVPLNASAWTVEPSGMHRPVALIQGPLHRLPTNGVRVLLERIRVTAPGTTVLLDLTGVQGLARAQWSARQLRRVGWSVCDDLELAFRDVLTGRGGDELCAGMVPIRLLHLVNEG